LMARAETVLDRDGLFYGIHIECHCEPGGHVLPVRWLPPGQVESPSVAGSPHWEFNGDLERPTLSPSILARADWGPERRPMVCHSFVRDGRIEFLSDCTHAFAGKTVDLPEVE
jgi:hypothetical protein